MTTGKAFLDALALNYDSGLFVADFASEPERERKAINGWVAERTEQRIEELLPESSIDGDTQKILQPGTVVARSTSGADSGKLGVYQATTPTDGRQTAANIVGVADTFLPWELLERDANIAYAYEGTVVQAWCFEYNAAGAQVVLSNTTRDAILALSNVALLFK